MTENRQVDGGGGSRIRIRRTLGVAGSVIGVGHAGPVVLYQR
jgi:hypothetical protein